MKYFLLCICLLGAAGNLKAQNAFYDARNLVRLQTELGLGEKTTLKTDTVLAILFKYAKQKQDVEGGKSKISNLHDISAVYGSGWPTIDKIRKNVLEGQNIDVKDLKGLGKLVRDNASRSTISKIEKTLKTVDSLLVIKKRYEDYLEVFKNYKLNPNPVNTKIIEDDKQLNMLLTGDSCPDSVAKAICIIQRGEEYFNGKITHLGGGKHWHYLLKMKI